MSEAVIGDRPRQSTRDTVLAVVAEMLFVLLPLLVIGIVLLVTRDDAFNEFFASPEWSFAAAVLMGQAIVKFVAGMPGERELVPERIAAAVAAMIVLGLVPSLTVLALVLTSDSPGPLLLQSQIVLFVVSIPVFILLGGIGHHWLRGRKRDPRRSD